MDAKRMTILSLLLTENKEKSKLINTEPKLDPEETRITIQQLTKLVFHAQKVISRAVKTWLMRRAAMNKTYYADIFYVADYDIADTVYLAGEFSDPEWKKVVPMNYSFYHRAFRATVKISEGNQFKFIVNGTFV